MIFHTFLYLGRVNLVDLQTVLNIDLSLIETKVSEIVGQENDLSLVLGQLINRFSTVFYFTILLFNYYYNNVIYINTFIYFILYQLI